MSRYGDEMIQELTKLLKVDLVKTAEKKEDEKEDKKEDKKEEKCEKCDKEKCECEKLAKEEAKEEAKKEKEEAKKEKEEAKKEKKDKKDKKKAEVMFGIVNDLVKLANELDDAGAPEASNLIDDALKVIMQNLDK